MHHILQKALLQIPLIGPKALLVISSLVHRLCQQNQTPCNEITEVQQFVHVLKQRLEGGCVVDDQSEITEVKRMVADGRGVLKLHVG